ncbi:ABC-2 type transport system ATP-binding protein [Salipaludibacillus aurantiacus]|uniref:ABC-2 type transport system ATP-binding protein n=2 Tax=Salipaludibacillus aurantiacus TaxID=1601833 RepID=A0A1H9RQH2_9BACI|nr:ABC-2 type transport system ATP-binding protein [Salipaludibacillus aurantiacus]
MKISGLSKTIHGKHILSDINFSIETGSIIGVTGRNGAGKTTLLRTMTGILDPTKGDVTIDGYSIFKKPQTKEQVIFVPDSSEAFKNYSTKEILTLYKNIYSKFDEEYFYGLMDRFSLPFVKKTGAYSKGMKALFSLIIAFSTGAKYILLDEPTDGLDVIVKKQVLQILVEEVAAKDVSIIISSHRLDELEFMANKIIMIKDGKVDSLYEIEEMKEMYKKVQLVFKEAMPQNLKKEVTILDQTGRVYTVIMDRNDPKLQHMIEETDPLLFEELPLLLEDIFVAKLGGVSNVS